MWVRQFGDAASESSTLWDATGSVITYPWNACMGPTRCAPLLCVIKGQKGAQMWVL